LRRFEEQLQQRLATRYSGFIARSGWLTKHHGICPGP
jgi:hypothetical protein